MERWVSKAKGITGFQCKNVQITPAPFFSSRFEKVQSFVRISEEA